TCCLVTLPFFLLPPRPPRPTPFPYTTLFRSWTPPGAGEAGALSHDVIHGLDITIPLGLPGPPVSRVALVLASTGPRNLAYFGVDLGGTRLVATDADVSIGDGVEHHLSAVEMLLVVTARRDLTEVASTTAPHAGPR